MSTPTNSNADELGNIYEIVHSVLVAPSTVGDFNENEYYRSGQSSPLTDGKDYRRYISLQIAKRIQSNYLPKAEVAGAIGGDQPRRGTTINQDYIEVENNLRHEIKRKLGLESE